MMTKLYLFIYLFNNFIGAVNYIKICGWHKRVGMNEVYVEVLCKVHPFPNKYRTYNYIYVQYMYKITHGTYFPEFYIWSQVPGI